MYKCITKILARELKGVLSDLVGNQQMAFIKKHRIGENILLAQELFQNYHRDKGYTRCALKVDLMKAYDTVRWNFLTPVIEVMGFPDIFIR